MEIVTKLDLSRIFSRPDIQEISKSLEGVSWGPWKQNDEIVETCGHPYKNGPVALAFSGSGPAGSRESRRKNARYLAAVAPDKISMLLHILRSVIEQGERAEAEAASLKQVAAQANAGLKELRGKIQSLQDTLKKEGEAFAVACERIKTLELEQVSLQRQIGTLIGENVRLLQASEPVKGSFLSDRAVSLEYENGKLRERLIVETRKLKEDYAALTGRINRLYSLTGADSDKLDRAEQTLGLPIGKDLGLRARTLRICETIGRKPTSGTFAALNTILNLEEKVAGTERALFDANVKIHTLSDEKERAMKEVERLRDRADAWKLAALSYGYDYSAMEKRVMDHYSKGATSPSFLRTEY